MMASRAARYVGAFATAVLLEDHAGPYKHSAGTGPIETLSDWNDGITSIRVRAQ